jgi:hypothetical protein
MIVTWWASGLHLWASMFFKHVLTFLVSKKEEDSDDLVERCWFIYQRLDKEKLPLVPQAKRTYCKLVFPNLRSEMLGVAQGSEQLRQRTSSYIFADEMGFWVKAQDVYTAALPTLQGGGRFLGVSSAYPGFFKKLVFDDLLT